MVKLEVELTDEQYEKVKQIEDQGITIGEGIDMLFDVVDKLHEDYAESENDKGILDASKKTKRLEKHYGEQEKTYELEVQDRKHKIKWAIEFFKY